MFLLVSHRKEFVERWKKPLVSSGESLCRCSSLADAVKKMQSTRVRLVVFDVDAEPGFLPAANAAFTRMIKQCRVLLAGEDFSAETEMSALAAGAAGCCSPSLSNTEMQTVIDVVQKGGIWVSGRTLPILLGRLQHAVAGAQLPEMASPEQPAFPPGWSELTPREKEVAKQVAKGASNKIIARHLDISDATIKAHLTSVFHKLHISNRLQLVLLLSGEQVGIASESTVA